MIRRIQIFGERFDWLRSLHQKPWHCHESLKNISFSEFIRKEWICLWDETANIEKNNPKYHTEILIERNPEDNNRFRNVLELRNVMNKYFLLLKESVKNYYPINYEILKEDQDILKKITTKFNIKLKNKNVVNIKGYQGSGKKYIPKIYDNILDKDLKFIKENLDWKQENAIGYQSEDYKKLNFFNTLKLHFKKLKYFLPLTL
jgi:hypothetical protein